MSLIATSIPTGPALVAEPEWCIQGLYDIFGPDEPPYRNNECANSTRGTQKSDFQTFCCDGDIRDTSYNLWSWPSNRTEDGWTFDLENMICCRAGNKLLPGGLQPIWNDYKRCEPGLDPTPLASLAATNTDNAELYLVTYKDASGVGDSVTDWTVTTSPTCLWIQTNKDIEMTEVEVPAAKLTTLPPPTTNRWGYPLTTSTSSRNQTSRTADSNPSQRTQDLSPEGQQSRASSPVASAFSRGSERTSLIGLVGLSAGLFALWML
jgi:hypothetical protein